MLNFKKIFFMAQRRTQPRSQWLIAVYAVVYVLVLNHCSAVVAGFHLLELLGRRPATDFDPNLLGVRNASANPKLLTCRDISRVLQRDSIGRGTTKEVFGGSYRGRELAVKMVTPSVGDVRACLDAREFRAKEQCYEYANYKLMKEIAYSLQLSHDRILKLLGFCVRGDAVTGSVRDQGVVSVVEVGKNLTKDRIKQFTWNERLQIGRDVAELLVFLERSPLGSLGMGDFSLAQFVTVGGRLKVSDLDDLSSEERTCRKSRDCSVIGEYTGIECINATCAGINAKSNLFLATVVILEPVFRSPPDRIAGRIDSLLGKLKNFEMNADELQHSLAILQAETYSVL